MRGFVPTPGITAHDHFFDSFARFGGNLDESRHLGEWLDELATRAAAQNEQYLELMHTPDFRHAAAIAKEIGWPATGNSADFTKLRDELLAHGLRDEVAIASTALDQAEKLRSERCGHKDEAPACKVEIRFLYEVLRGFPKEQVFAQTLLGRLAPRRDGPDGLAATYFSGRFPKTREFTSSAVESLPRLLTFERDMRGFVRSRNYARNSADGRWMY